MKTFLFKQVDFTLGENIESWFDEISTDSIVSIWLSSFILVSLIYIANRVLLLNGF